MKKTFRQLLRFQGRADRKEFWKVNLIVLVIGLALQLIAIYPLGSTSNQIQSYFEGLLSSFTVVSTWPLLALGSRRLHDIGKSGWWQLLILTGIGIIPLTIWFLKKGEENDNIYEPVKD